MIRSLSTNDSSDHVEGSADAAQEWAAGDAGHAIAIAREAVKQLEAGEHPETAPTTLFRLALELRHSGNMEEATLLFRQSGRMLTEQYMSQRLHLRRRGA